MKNNPARKVLKMSLKEILNFCGIPDERIHVKENEISKGKPHNALEDCKLEGECISRIKFGKNLFPEYAKFPVPEVLKK